jgi:SAM-dependent methyltransferase
MTSSPRSLAFPAGSVDQKLYHNKGNPQLLRMLPDTSRRILDVGCGAGDNARLMAASGRLIDGITLSREEADAAAAVCEKVFVHDLETGLPSDLPTSYEAVVCSHVLEHLRWPDRVLHTIRSLLQPHDGYLLVALPNVLFYKNRIQLASGYFDYEESGIMDASHFRWFTYASSRRLIEEAGFDVLRHEGDGSFPLPLVRRLIGRTIAGAVDRAAVRSIPGLFAHQILLLATPKP